MNWARSRRVEVVAHTYELRVDVDGLVRGYLVRLEPGRGKVWAWRTRDGSYGSARTKAEAIQSICEGAP